MGETLASEGSHKAPIFDEAFWRWQYEDLPEGEARVYLAESHGDVAGYYHVPIYRATVGATGCRAAQVQDVAVQARMRGMGVFRRLAEFAMRDLEASPVDFIYTFPNDKSIHTFLKYNGFRRVVTLRAYVLPMKTASVLRRWLPRSLASLLGGAMDALARAVRRPSPVGFDVVRERDPVESVGGLFRDYAASRGVALERGGDFLRWRFVARPHSRHFVFSRAARGVPVAAAVFKLDEVFGAPALVLMDFAHSPGRAGDLLDLIGAVVLDPVHVGEPFSLAFTAGTGAFFAGLRRIGFVGVPRWIDPRPLHLLVRDVSGTAGAAIRDASAWHVTLTDWDVF